MRATRSAVPALILLTLGFLASSAAHAQSSATVNPDLNPYGSLNGGDFESVTVQNRLLDLHIPLISYPQRGNLHLGFNVVYNNHTFGSKQICTTTCTVYWYQTGLGLNIYPDLEYAQQTSWATSNLGQVKNFSAYTADGAAHAMGSTSSHNWFAMDGTGFQYDSTADILIDSHGVRTYGSNTDSTYNPVVPTKVEDANGNLLTTTLSTGSTVPTVITDSLGRSIPLAPTTSDPGTSQTSDFTGCTGVDPISVAYNWTLPGVNGGTSVFKICYANITVKYPTTGCSPNGNPKCMAFNVTEKMIQSIVLPNGTAWTFAYDGTGDLTSITLPTGGTITYAWTVVYNSNNMTAATYITSRSIDANDGSGSHTWTYGANSAVADPDGNQTFHTFGQSSCYGGALGPYRCGYETETQYYQNVGGTLTLLKTVNTDYQYSAGSGNLLSMPIRVTTTWPNGSVTKTEKSYDTTGVSLTGNFSGHALLGQVTEQRDYDYGSGAAGSLLRRTDTVYMATPPSSTYFTNGLLRIPSTVTTYNASGTQMALTTYSYDSGSLTSSGVSSTYHDGAPPDGANRGNVTSVTRWLNTPASNLISTNSYYDTGLLYVSKTPNLNPTTRVYTCTGAYLQTVTDAVGHVTTYTPDCNTGQVLSVKDQNNQITSHQYDAAWRLTQTNFPDGGLVTECYSDTAGSSCAGAPPYQVITTTLLSSGNMIGTEVFDGLGRLSQKQVNSDPGGTDYSDITYDELGRKHSESNPYRSKTESTYGVTTYTYDALGRTTAITRSDNSTIAKSYTGAATELTDEGNGTTNVTRVYQADGLNRLASVCEVTSATQLGTSGTPAACGQDIAATGFFTTYVYDALGNLVSASQAGLSTRSFTYDSLSRLISDFNPEAGTISYAYDGDSNLTSRTAPKPNQTNPAVTVTTTYGYDALDRLASKTYNDGSTPSVAMTYDVQPANSPGTLNYPIGRLLEASSANATTWESYDPMGRAAEEWQCTPANCGSGTFTLPYTYGPAGELLTFMNGAGVTLTNQYDTANQITRVTSSLQDSNHPASLLSNATYNALGQVSELTLGNGLNENYNYDNRLRLTSMTAGTVYSLTMGYAPDSDVTSAIDTANGSWTYTYDSFNRISASNKSSGSQAFTYAYDRYGNRWQQNVTAGSGPSLSISFSGANNRVDGYSYDAAGNLLNDGSHSYTYDAENRIIQVDAGTTAAYVYDAFGRRVQKTSAAGTISYLYDLAGRQVTELNSSQTWTRTEIYAGGKHLATYSGGALGATSFIHADWLGTERVRTDVTGAASETCTGLPFGDGQSCTGTDVSPLHFTGKQRDTESNLDDFGARYYSSSMGRWMTPDWSAREEAVPYVDMHNPQTLNLYGYVGNNPTTATDPDGHFREVIGGQNNGCWFQAADACNSFAPSTTTNDSGSDTDDQTASPPSQQPQTPQAPHQYDPKKSGPEDPTNPGHPLFENSDVKKASDQAFMKTTNGEARDKLAEAGFAIDYKDGKLSIVNKVDSVHGDGKPSELHIKTDPNTIAILHTHGNRGGATPSPGDVKSPVPNFVRSKTSLYVTVPGTTTYIQLQ